MIVTVTPNPSLDRTFDVDMLHVGEVNRAHATHVHPGGKGINVSRALARNGVATCAVLPVGGPDGAEVARLLDALALPSRTVPVAQATRSNIAVVDAIGSTTKVNAAGPALDAEEVGALVATVAAELDRHAGEDDTWLVLAGSTPGGAGADLYLRLLDEAGPRGVAVAVDASDDALRGVVEHGGARLLKPNLEELSALLGSELRTIGDIVAGAHTVRAHGHEAVLVSLGPDGALLVTGEGSWWAGGEPVVPRSTVGAGDCTLAGYLSASGSPEDRLRAATTWGRAAVALPGSATPGPDDLDPAAVAVVADPPPHLRPDELRIPAAHRSIS